jgi:ferredoxin
MRVRLLEGKCSGHAQCYAVDERLFPIDEMGYSTVTVSPIRSDDEEQARRGVAACPERVLVIEHDL